MKKTSNVIKDSYKNYRFKNDRYKVSADLKEYSDIAKEFFKNLFEIIVLTGGPVELPSRLGQFVIEQYNVVAYNRSLKERNKSIWNIDYKSSKKYEELYGYKVEKEYTNKSTNNKMWSFNWLKSNGVTFKNKPLYSFKLVRSNVRSTSNKKYSSAKDRLCVHDFFLKEGQYIYRELAYSKIKNND